MTAATAWKETTATYKKEEMPPRSRPSSMTLIPYRFSVCLSVKIMLRTLYAPPSEGKYVFTTKLDHTYLSHLFR